MPRDLFDYFLKRDSNRIFKEVTNIVRETLWRETVDFIKSEEWILMENQKLIDLYIYLRYN